MSRARPAHEAPPPVEDHGSGGIIEDATLARMVASGVASRLELDEGLLVRPAVLEMLRARVARRMLKRGRVR